MEGIRTIPLDLTSVSVFKKFYPNFSNFFFKFTKQLPGKIWLKHLRGETSVFNMHTYMYGLVADVDSLYT